LSDRKDIWPVKKVGVGERERERILFATALQAYQKGYKRLSWCP